MRRSRSIVALCAALASVSAVATSGATTLPESQVYIHCNGETKISNLHAVVDSAPVKWDERKGGPLADGNGCATPETFATGTGNQNPIYDFPFSGEFDGEIDSMTIRLWGADLSGSRALGEWTTELHIVVDGEEILPRAEGVAVEAEFPVAGARTSAARLYEVTVTDVAVPAGIHEVVVTVYSKYVDGSGVTTWLFDSAEYDSGVVFNDASPAATTIQRP